MISNLFKPYLFYRFLIFVFTIFGVTVISSVAYAVPATSSGSDGHYYYVHKGDTLSHIAQYYGVSANDLVYYNSLSSPDHIRVGQPLYIPASSPQPDKSKECYSYHKIARGQTLSWIAKHYGVDLHKLAEVNHIHNLNYIKIGQKLCIPSIPTNSETRSSSSHQVTIRSLARGDDQENLVYEIDQEESGDIFSNPEEFFEETPFLALISQYGDRILFARSEDEISPESACVNVDLVWEETQHDSPIMTYKHGKHKPTIVDLQYIDRVCQFSSGTDLLTLEKLIISEIGGDYHMVNTITKNLDGQTTLWKNTPDSSTCSKHLGCTSQICESPSTRFQRTLRWTCVNLTSCCTLKSVSFEKIGAGEQPKELE